MKKILAAGGLVFNDLHQLLMIYRHEKWDLPKGHLEKNETLEQCALREVREETGLKNLTISRFVGITNHTCFDSYLRADAIKETHWFAMHTPGGNTFPQLKEGIEWTRWVARTDLDQYLRNTYNNIRVIITKGLAQML